MTTAKPIAFFDVDKTLCDCYCGYHTTIELIRRRIIKKRRLIKAVFYNAIGRVHLRADVRRMYEIALGDMAGTQLSEIMKIGRHIFETKVRPKMYQEGIAEIERLRNQGFLIALISSSPYMTIRIMQEFLGADISFSNGPVIREGILQREFQEPLCYKEGKVAVAEKFASSQGVSLQDCLFYSDSFSDLPLLSKVGHPFIVNPDRKLERTAQEKNWPILRFEKTLSIPKAAYQ